MSKSVAIKRNDRNEQKEAIQVPLLVLVFVLADIMIHSIEDYSVGLMRSTDAC